jgi:hypothetical protein
MAKRRGKDRSDIYWGRCPQAKTAYIEPLLGSRHKNREIAKERAQGSAPRGRKQPKWRDVAPLLGGRHKKREATNERAQGPAPPLSACRGAEMEGP